MSGPAVEYRCHCGRDVYVEDFGGVGEPFTRNMCEDCSLVRCDLGDVRCPYDARPGKEARELIETALARFALSRTLTKKIAAAVLDEFRVTTGQRDDGGTMLVLMRGREDSGGHQE